MATRKEAIDNASRAASRFGQQHEDRGDSGRAGLLVWGVVAGALLIAVGTALGALLNTPGTGLRTAVGGPSLGLGLLRSIGIGPLDWLACAVSSPLFVWLARRYPIRRQRWVIHLPLHLGVAMGFVMVVGVLYYAWVLPPPPATRPDGFLRFFLISHLFSGGPPFGVMIAAIHALEFYRRYREREVEAARLHAQLTASRLEALTAQLHPHFLFNTLQWISTLLYRDARAADAMLTGLSDLLRLTLQRGTRQEVRLDEELEVLALYVGICRERFQDRLVFETHIDDAVRDAVVPFFILQPLVENAFNHGIARRAGTGHVTVRVHRQGERLYLSVTDDGPGLDGHGQPIKAEGIGLPNVRSRLRQLYGDQQSLRLERPAQGGWQVALTIPYRVVSSKGEEVSS